MKNSNIDTDTDGQQKKLYQKGQKTNKPINANDFLEGMYHCKHGRKADPNRGEDYHRGYDAQYTAEMNVTNLSTQQNEAMYEH